MRASFVLGLVLLAMACIPGEAAAQNCELSWSPPRVIDGGGRLADGLVGQQWTATITVSGGTGAPYDFGYSKLLPGVTSFVEDAQAGTVTISGTPSAIGHHRMSIHASSQGGNCPTGATYDVEVGPPDITNVIFDTAACDDQLYIYGFKLEGYNKALPQVTLAGLPAQFTHDGYSFNGHDILLVKPLPAGLPTSGVPFEIKVTTDGGSTGSDTHMFTLKGNLPAATTGAATVDEPGRKATMTGTVNAGCVTTEWWFDYGKQQPDGTFAYTDKTPTKSAGGKTDVAVSDFAAFLEQGATYHYRLTASNGEGVVHGADMTFSLGGGDTHIAPVSAPLNKRLDKLRGLLLAQTDDLKSQRLLLEPQLEAEQAALEKAIAEQDAVATAEKAVRKAAAAVNDAIEALDRADNHVPADVQKLVDKRDDIARRMRKLEDEILALSAKGKAKEAAKLVPQLESMERQLERASKAVVRALPKKRFGPLLEALRRAQKALAKRMDELERRARHALNAREQAELPFRRDLARRTELDRQLLELAERLAHADLKFKGVNVEAGGLSVFTAVTGGPFERLHQIEQELFEAGNVLADLDIRRRFSKDEFIALQGDASVALSKLEIAIRRTSYGKAGVDLLFNAYDIGEAFAKGGLIGAAAEAGKKLLEEFVLKEYLTDAEKPDPTSAEGIANAEFNADLKEAFQFRKLAGDTAVKQTLGKAGKDTFNSAIGTGVFQKVYGSVPEEWHKLEVKPPEPLTVKKLWADIKKTVSKAGDRETQFKNLKKGFEAKFRKVGFGMLKGLLKDMAKAKLKSIVGEDESRAWRAYFAAETKARLYFPVYQALARAYWDVYDHIKQLEAEQRDLLATFHPQTGLQVTRDEKFPKTSTLLIHLDIDRTIQGADPEVLVGGVPATMTAPGEYTLPLSALGTVPDALSLEIR